MSIVSVDNISPIGSGTSVTVNSAATLVLNNANSTGVITATSFVGSGANLTSLPAANLTGTLPAISGANLTGITQTTINNNANNRIITGSGTANTLEAEANLVFDGTKLGVNQSTPTAELEVCSPDPNTTSTLFIHTPKHNTSVASEAILKFGYGHSGSPDGVGHIKMVEQAGNSFDADLIFGLPTNGGSGGSVTNERLRIKSNGAIGLSGANYGTSGQVLTSQGSSSAPTWAAAGITMVDQWRPSSSFALGGAVSIINSNWERVDAPSGYGTIGSAMTESSGVFTFPSTGIYYIEFICMLVLTGTAARYCGNRIQTTVNNSSYSNTMETLGHVGLSNSFGAYNTTTSSVLFDVTDTSQCKVRFCATSIQHSNTSVIGNSSTNSTAVTFIRLGDT